LQFEDIFKIAVKLVRPDVGIGRCVDQLRRHSNPLTSCSHATFQHIAHPEFAADLPDIDGLALVGEG
jgi:hypothetical protein